MADRFLRARADGFVYVWTKDLAKRSDEFDPCDVKGRLLGLVEVEKAVEDAAGPTVIPRKNKGGRPSKASIQAAIAAPLKVDSVEDVDPSTLKT